MFNGFRSVFLMVSVTFVLWFPLRFLWFPSLDFWWILPPQGDPKLYNLSSDSSFYFCVFKTGFRRFSFFIFMVSVVARKHIYMVSVVVFK